MAHRVRLLPVEEWPRLDALLGYAYAGEPRPPLDPQQNMVVVAEDTDSGDPLAAVILARAATLQLVCPVEAGAPALVPLTDAAISLLGGELFYTFLPEGPEGEALASELELVPVRGVVPYAGK